MAVTITPEQFTLVLFDVDALRAVAERMIDLVGLPAGTELRIEVDETTPLGRARLTSLDPLTISVESGALEDPKHPRHLSPGGAADVIGRLLFRVVDRADAAFGTPPPDDELTLQLATAWDAYSVGRLVRRGHRHFDNRQRRLYHFRNRHGFTDAADEAFSRLWEAEGLTWDDIAALSDGALTAESARAAAES